VGWSSPRTWLQGHRASAAASHINVFQRVTQDRLKKRGVVQ